MKRKPFSVLGHYVQIRREQHLLRRRKLARLIGFADGKDGARAIRTLEEEGVVYDPPDLLERIAVILHLDEAVIEMLQSQDRQASLNWLRKNLQPFRPYLGVRTVPLPSMSEIPDEVLEWGSAAIEDYAREYARSMGMEVHAVLSRRIRLVIDRWGEVVEIREGGRSDEFSN